MFNDTSAKVYIGNWVSDKRYLCKKKKHQYCALASPQSFCPYEVFFGGLYWGGTHLCLVGPFYFFFFIFFFFFFFWGGGVVFVIVVVFGGGTGLIDLGLTSHLWVALCYDYAAPGLNSTQCYI